MSRPARRARLRAAAIASIGLISSSNNALAVDRLWSNTAGGTFTVGSNWSGGVFPGATDSAIFDLGSSSGYTVFFPVTLSTDTLRVRNDRVSFNLNARTYTLNNTGNDAVIIGQSTGDAGRLTLTNGTLSSNGGVNVGYGAVGNGGAGSLTIDTGGRLVLGADDSLSIGRSSSAGGTVSLVNGGQIIGGNFAVVGNGGTLTSSLSINGAGSSFAVPGSVQVGGTSHGRLSLLGSGASFSANTLAVGQQSSGFGTVTHNSSSSVNVGTLVVGQFGTGNYTLGAASLTTSHTEIGEFGAGTVLVSSSSANWTNSGTLVVGGSGPGSLRLQFGGDITTGRLLVAEHEGSTGHVVLDDDSTINTGSIDIGAGGTGTLEILRGSDVVATGRLYVGFFQGGSVPDRPSSGTILVDGVGSSLTTSGFNIGYTQGDGTVTVRNGASLNTGAGSVNIGAGGNAGTVMLQGTGTSWTANRIDVGSGGAGLVDLGPGTSLMAGGTFTVGTFGTVNVTNASVSVGTLARNGVLNFNSGTLNVTGAGGLAIGAGGPLGATLVVDTTRHINVTNTLTNNGLVRGDGTVAAGHFVNAPAGEVRVSGDEQLAIATGTLTNSGQVTLLGGLLDVSGSIVNSTSGRVSGRGALRAASITNGGTIALSAGAADVFANLTNNATGKTIVTGNATAVFYGTVTNLTGSEFRVSSGATAVMLGAVSGLGQFTGSGTTIFEGPASLGAIDRTGTTLVEPSGSLVATRVREHALIVNGAATILPNGTSDATSRVTRLEIGGGRLDVTNNDLVIDYDGASPIADVRQQIRSGFDNGSWNGDGIVTSMGNASNFGLGCAEASAIFASFPATFSGQAVDDTSVLVAFTRFGDANLDGAVNLLDFNRLAANFGQAGRFWQHGDFNYDGVVNLLDFNRLAGNFGQSAAGASVSPQEWAALAAAVPEPANAVFAAPLFGLLHRRRAPIMLR